MTISGRPIPDATAAAAALPTTPAAAPQPAALYASPLLSGARAERDLASAFESAAMTSSSSPGASSSSPMMGLSRGISPVATPGGATAAAATNCDSPSPAQRPGWMPSQLSPLADTVARSTPFPPLASTVSMPDRVSYESIGLYRLRCKAALSTFIFYANRGFCRRLEASGSSDTWGRLDPVTKVICIGDALDGAAAVPAQTLQRLLLNSAVVSTGNLGLGGGSRAADTATNDLASAVALAGYDPVVSAHVSIRLSTMQYGTVDMRDFLVRWIHGQEPCDMVEDSSL
jgi:hypothetical protein